MLYHDCHHQPSLFHHHCYHHHNHNHDNNNHHTTVRVTADGGAELAGDPKVNIFTE